MSLLGQSRPRLPALAPPDVGYASINDQSFAAPRLVAMGHEQTFEKRRLHAKFRIRGDDQSGCVSVETSSDGPNAGRYRPNFNSKSLGTP